MIILSETTDNLQIVLGNAVTTNQLQCFTSWRDRTSTTFIAGRTTALTNDTTDVNLTSGPVASTQRIIDFISVYNTDTVENTITIKIDDNGTDYILWKDVLAPGDAVRFVEGSGFNTYRTYQVVKSFTVNGAASANWALTNATLAERFAGNTTRTIFSVDLEGYSQVRLRVNRQVAGIAGTYFTAKYYNAYSTTVSNYLTLGSAGDVQVQLNATTYVDTGWLDMVAGAKITGAFIAFTEQGGDGVADPAVGATDILFR